MNTLLSLLLLALVPFALARADPSPSYFDEDDTLLDDYPSDNDLDRLLQTAQKRSSLIYLYRRACVRRGGNCDHRPNDCCYNSTCRCNLWGANCRCQRKGLFQKWGK